MVEAAEETRFSLLPDPISDRPLTDAQCPKIINRHIEDAQLFGPGDVPNWKLLKDYLSREGQLTKPQVIRLLNAALQCFS